MNVRNTWTARLEAAVEAGDVEAVTADVRERLDAAQGPLRFQQPVHLEVDVANWTVRGEGDDQPTWCADLDGCAAEVARRFVEG